MHIQCTVDVTGECEPSPVFYRNDKQAERVANRIGEYCGKPIQDSEMLILYKDQIECTRKVLFKEYGFLRKKQQKQVMEFYK